MINWKLCVILDKALIRNRELKKLAEDVIRGGADVIQLRDKASSAKVFLKDARSVREIAARFNIPFIVNDRVDIAKASYADGVHLGQTDLPISAARAILGKYKLIGVSCHSIEQAVKAQKDGADYIGFGPIFKTAVKANLEPIGTDLINEVRKNLNIPVACIGGINIENIKELLDAGAETVAIASAVINSDNPKSAAGRIKNTLEKKDDAVRVC